MSVAAISDALANGASGAREAQKRRSWLIVPASKSEQIEEAATSGADVVVLDLVELVAEQDKARARAALRDALAASAAADAEVFVQTGVSAAAADLPACVWPGVTGIVVSRIESPAD